jgi:hypothetical protein
MHNARSAVEELKHSGSRYSIIAHISSCYSTKTLDTVISGLRLAEAFTYTPKPMLPRKQIEAMFGPEQFRNTELLEAFAAHLPGYVSASTPEVSQKFIERPVLEDKLWEQLHVSLLERFGPKVPFPDELWILMAFFDIFDVAFDVLKESTIIDWGFTDLDLTFRTSRGI